jgi:hypothetical protein
MKNEFDLSWFDLSKYDALKDFDGYEWFIALRKRRFLKKLINEKPHIALKQIELWKERPVVDYKVKECNEIVVTDATFEDFLRANNKNPNIKFFYEVLGYLFSNNDSSVYEESNGVSIDELVKADPYASILKQVISIDDPILSVDLNVSDEQLINEFIRWLQVKREQMGTPPRQKMFTSTDFYRWKNLRILPYLDLTIMASFERKKLTYNYIGQKLFPDIYDVDLTQKVRQQVKPLADSLIMTENLSVLKFSKRKRDIKN